MHRRNFLKVIGGASVVGSAVVYIWAAPTAQSARAAWGNAEQYHDPMRFALSHAILAPNPHNRQPWLVEMVSDKQAILYCDPNRHLPVTDPLDRQITIGLGCFLELFALAAQHKGMDSQMSLFPEGSHDLQLDGRPVAIISLTPSSTKTTNIDTDLFHNILNRRTDRSAFSNKVPSTHKMQNICKVAGDNCLFTNETKRVAAVIEICKAATNIEFLTPQTHEESAKLMRVGRKAVAKNPDGISIEGPMIELLNLGGALRPKAMRDPNSSAFKQGLSMYQKAVASAQSFLWIPTHGNTRLDQILAGRAYVRANLKASSLGLSMHPLSQCLQEYSEMQEPLINIHKLLNINTPNRIQMLARIGYGNAKTKSPRWSLETRFIGR